MGWCDQGRGMGARECISGAGFGTRISVDYGVDRVWPLSVGLGNGDGFLKCEAVKSHDVRES